MKVQQLLSRCVKQNRNKFNHLKKTRCTSTSFKRFYKKLQLERDTQQSRVNLTRFNLNDDGIGNNNKNDNENWDDEYVKMSDVSSNNNNSENGLGLTEEEEEVHAMSPEEIKSFLDKFIVGQDDAKKAIAVAMRNRWRWKQLDEKIRKEVIPKNILMIGPTGVGKTEIARRVAKLTQSPFIKVEATKYTEVGFKGEDVDSIIKQLVTVGMNMEKEKHANRVKKRVHGIAENKILDLILGPATEDNESKLQRDSFRGLLNEHLLEDILVEYEEDVPLKFNFPSGDGGVNALKDFLSNTVVLKKTVYKLGSISQLRNIVEKQESQKILQKSESDLIKRAIKSVEEEGIVFIDEIDKICGGHHFQADASDEGVQRDLLPIIEGTKIKTDHGEVDTSKILFITAGAFLQNKPTDLLAELLGRLPIRVRLVPLSKSDLHRILVEPEIDLITQNKEMMKTEGVDLRFSDEAIQTIAEMGFEMNEKVEDIGARRLFTVMEKVMEEFSYNAHKYKGQTIVIDGEMVRKALQPFLIITERNKYIL